MWAWVSYIIRRGLWAPVAVLAFDTFLDFTFDIYARYPSYDVVSHTLGGMAIAYLFSIAYRAPNAQKFLGSHSKFSYFLFSICFCGLVCIVWEFSEWLSDCYMGSQHQLGIGDTMGDFFFGLLGAGLVSFFCSRSLRQ